MVDVDLRDVVRALSIVVGLDEYVLTRDMTVEYTGRYIQKTNHAFITYKSMHACANASRTNRNNTDQSLLFLFFRSLIS